MRVGIAVRIAGLIVLLLTSLGAQEKAAQIEALISRYHEFGYFNGTALVAEQGTVIVKKGYGLAHMEWEIPNTPDTRFRLGSITKQFTAALILQLVNEGKVKLTDPISSYLPDYPAKTADRVTVHQLLNHTSGIPSYTGRPGFFENVSRNPYSVADFIKTFSALDLEFEPGTKYRYNNSGYFLLGAIIEKVTGDTYENALRKRIIEPLGLAGTGYDWHGPLIPKRARGYERSLAGIRNAPYLDMALPYAAGSMYSTVEDLYQWDRALYTDAVLPPASRELMYKPNLDNYAYGWVVRTIDHPTGDGKMTLLEHGGGINGFSTVISRIPEQQHLVVLLNNTGNAPLQDMVTGIRSILYGKPAEMPRKPVAPLLLETYKARGAAAAVAEFEKWRSADDKSLDLSSRELARFGQHLRSERKNVDAILVLKRLTGLFPLEWQSFLALGDALSAAGEKEPARKAFAKALEYAPESAAALVAGKLKDLYP